MSSIAFSSRQGSLLVSLQAEHIAPLLMYGGAAARVCRDSLHAISFSVQGGLSVGVCSVYVVGVLHKCTHT